MDVRLFKFLVVFGSEAILGIAHLIEWKYFSDNRIGMLVFNTTRLAMLTVPLLMMLPEDNWIWLLEEDQRSRKITLRSKAVKHLHLSLLYFMAVGYPVFLVTMSLFIWSQWEEKYRFPPNMAMGIFAFVFGVFCAFKHNVNVKKYDSLFAVAWDRKSAFPEIFVGLKVARNPRFFFKGFSLAVGLIFLVGSVAATPFFFKVIQPTMVVCEIYDRQKCIVMQTVFCFLFSNSIWAVTMYSVFQLLFTRRLEAWVREKRIGGEPK